MLKTPTPLPVTRQKDTDTDKFFAYLASHATRSPDVQPIATISQDQSARRTWTTPQITILCILAAMTIIALWTFGIVILTAIFAAVTVLYVALLCLGIAWMTAVARATPSTPFNDEIIQDLADAPWPSYTILCPLYREKAVVPQFVNAMKALDYPSDCLQVLFLTEEDDADTRNAIHALNLPPHFQIVTVPQGTPKTKPRACNYGLQQATGEYVVIFDAEDIPDPLQLKKAILTFASNDVNVACVQACLNFYNPVQNLLTRFFTIEYSLWFDLILPGIQRLGFSLPLGGTSNHFRISALKALGGWDAFNVTEDCDLGLKLAKYGFRTIMLDSTTYEEANSRKLSWIRQRSRWIKGYMQTYLVHTRHPLSALKKGKIKDVLSLHLFVGAGSIVLLINPVMWAMFAVYLIWRPVDLYHHLFPWPVLYAGMLCFLVGNFLPIYISMIACVKREQYALVKWCLLLPLYWVLASIAAFLAGYELIAKPHHWHKTQHGLHLKDKKSTAKVAAIQRAGKVAVSDVSSQAVGNITQSVRAMLTVPMPAVSKAKDKRKIRVRDPWLVLTIAIACVCSIAATAYFFHLHELTFYSDALSHMRISRGVFDSSTPGLAQLGAEWLPLPHIIMWPFIWNDYLWRTGLAGSFSSMPCYIVASVFIFLSIRRLTKSGGVSFIGTLVFILNPNVLYLQSTPLSEAMCMATFATSTYFFLCWIQQNGQVKYLILVSVSTFFATLARYDGWALFASILAFILIIDWLNRKSVSRLIADGVMFSVLGGMGIILWFSWNLAIFGSPFYFKNSMYSAQWQQQQLLHAGHLTSYHNLWQSFLYYGSDSVQNGGIILCLLAIVGMLWFIWKQRRSVELFAVLVFIVPFVFYIVSLYTGQAAIWVAGVNPPGTPFPYFNIRYGSQVVAPVAVLLSLLVYRWRISEHIQNLVKLLLLFTIIGQCFVSFYQGIFVLKETGDTYVCSPLTSTAAYVAQHYNGGYILEDLHATNMDPTLMNVDFKDVIWEGSNVLLARTLRDPANHATWIFVNLSNPTDIVSQHINVQSSAFLANFSLVAKQNGGIELFHRNGQPLTPLRSISSILSSQHKSC